jgi:hypothetical protein
LLHDTKSDVALPADTEKILNGQWLVTNLLEDNVLIKIISFGRVYRREKDIAKSFF